MQTNPGEDGPWDTCSIPYADKIGIATGNWGCGAFGGDVDLKSMLQWLAASQVSNTFGDNLLKTRVYLGRLHERVFVVSIM